MLASQYPTTLNPATRTLDSLQILTLTYCREMSVLGVAKVNLTPDLCCNFAFLYLIEEYKMHQNKLKTNFNSIIIKLYNSSSDQNIKVQTTKQILCSHRNDMYGSQNKFSLLGINNLIKIRPFDSPNNLIKVRPLTAPTAIMNFYSSKGNDMYEKSEKQSYAT